MRRVSHSNCWRGSHSPYRSRRDRLHRATMGRSRRPFPPPPIVSIPVELRPRVDGRTNPAAAARPYVGDEVPRRARRRASRPEPCRTERPSDHVRSSPISDLTDGARPRPGLSTRAPRWPLRIAARPPAVETAGEFRPLRFRAGAASLSIGNRGDAHSPTARRRLRPAGADARTSWFGRRGGPVAVSALDLRPRSRGPSAPSRSPATSRARGDRAGPRAGPASGPVLLRRRRPGGGRGSTARRWRRSAPPSLAIARAPRCRPPAAKAAIVAFARRRMPPSMSPAVGSPNAGHLWCCAQRILPARARC